MSKEQVEKIQGEHLKKPITIFVGFIHDFAAGCWAATVLAIYWISNLQSRNPELAQALSPLEIEFFYLGLACVAIVLLTGMGRTFTYIENVYGKDAEKLRKKMLIFKHFLLFGIFGTGTYWQYTMVFN
jgi:putative copper export protein